MAIYYLMIEAIPNHNNPEAMEFGGAYVNCWVKADTQEDALNRVSDYIKEENWLFLKIEEQFIAQRDFYMDEPDSLECYDEACQNGCSAIFYTWPIEEGSMN